MMYKIEITKIEVEEFKDKEYNVVGKKENGEDQYGYTYFDSTREVRTSVYSQLKPDLDLDAVIKAVNEI